MVNLHKTFYRFPENLPLPLILDGATGTALMREGMSPGACPEAWILENPDVLKRIQASYRNAGSDVVYTPTFTANSATLEKYDLNKNVIEINHKLAALSIEKGSLAAADMSATGLFIEPYGDATFDFVVDVYTEQAKALDESGIDFYAIETMFSLNEARAAVIGIRKVSDKPIFVTLTVNEKGRTMSGDKLDCSLLTLSELGINAFGVNCSVGPADTLKVLKPLVPLSVALGIPLIAKPNAGMPHEHPDGSRSFDLSAEEFSFFIPEFLENNILILGGCCGTDEEYIKGIKAAVDKFTPSQIPEKADIDKVACTNRIISKIENTDNFITIDDDFVDEIDEDEDYVCLLVEDIKAAEIFKQESFSINLPVVMTGDRKAIDFCRYYYNGKIFVI